MIAFYRKQYDVVLDKANSAFIKYPWLYEIKALEGDALLAKGTEMCDAGNYSDGMRNLDLASESYKFSLATGRSDAHIHEGIGDALIHKTSSLLMQGKDFGLELKSILEISSQSLQVNPSREKGKLHRAYAHFWIGFMKGASGQDSREDLQKSIESVDLAIKNNSKNAYSYDMLGNGYYWIGVFEKDHNRDPIELWKKAEISFDRSLSIEQRFPWAHNDRGLLLQGIGIYLAQRGGDWQTPLLRSISSFQRAIENDKAYAAAYSNQLDSYYSMVELMNRFNRDPVDLVNRAKSVYRDAMLINKSVVQMHYNMSNILIQYAEYLINNGRNADAIIKSAGEYFDLVSNMDDDVCFGDVIKLKIRVAESMTMIDGNSINESWLDDFEKTVDRCRKKVASQGQCDLLKARLYNILLQKRNPSNVRSSLYVREMMRAAAEAKKAAPDNSDIKQIYVSARLTQINYEKNRDMITKSDIDTAKTALTDRPNDGLNHANLAAYYLAASRVPTLGDYIAQSGEHFRQAVSLNPLLARSFGKEIVETEARLAARGGANQQAK